eukprot:IDg3631t1
MPPSLTYLAEHLVGSKPHTNISWAITVTEREQFERLGGKLACVFGNKRNCDNFFALLRKVYRLCPLWFSINWQGETEVLEEKQRRSTFIGFDPWRN